MRPSLLLVGLVINAVAAHSALAATYEATFRGLVNSPDPTNPITGDPTPGFTLTFDYTVDPSKVTSTATSTIFKDTLGSETASISIDGVNGGAPVVYKSSGYFQVSAYQFTTGGSQFDAEIELPNNGSLSATFTRSDDAIPNSVTTPVPTLFADGGIPNNISNYIGGYDLIDPNNPNNDIIDDLYPSSFSLTVSALSAVPLPSSAPMFGAALLAVGAAGYGLKRRKAAKA